MNFLSLLDWVKNKNGSFTLRVGKITMLIEKSIELHVTGW